jgi:hypothetical protein
MSTKKTKKKHKNHDNKETRDLLALSGARKIAFDGHGTFLDKSTI